MIYKSATFTKTIIYLYFLDNIKIQFGSELKSLIKGHFRRYSVKQSTFFIVIYKESLSPFCDIPIQNLLEHRV